MPNYVKNEVQFIGSEKRIEEIKKLLKTEDNEFDFNSLIPMPKSLNMISGTEEEIAIKCAYAKRGGKTTCDRLVRNEWANAKMNFDEWAKLGEEYLRNKELYGATTWYDWCINNWGTKWNACDAYWWGECSVTFDTAWSTPVPVFEKLAKLFPDVQFRVRFADEDLGNNCGYITYLEGVFSVDCVDDYGMACELWGVEEEEYDDEETNDEFSKLLEEQ